MFERFTPDARAAVVSAQDESRGLARSWIGTEHLLLGLLVAPATVAAATLADFGVTIERGRAAVVDVLNIGDGLGPTDAEALRSLGIDLGEVRRHVEASFGPRALDEPRPPCGRDFFGRRHRPRPGTEYVPFARRAKQVLEQARREALAREDHQIGTEHVLLGLLAIPGTMALQVLTVLGADPAAVRTALLDRIGRAA